jgi:hypothetical protein
LAACQHLLAERARSCGTRSLSPESPLQESSKNPVNAKFAEFLF